MTETQERFLRAIAEHVPPARVVEVHLFPSLRQGQVESGVAVVASDEERGEAGGLPGAPPASGASPDESATAEPPVAKPTDDAAAADYCDPAEAAADTGADAQRGEGAPLAPESRHTIYAAHYRLTIKGPDRGKWELGVSAEADAPLVTLEAVVRGVRHRAGDGAESERLSGEEFRAIVAGLPGDAWKRAR
jgi:hypothetical protein